MKSCKLPPEITALTDTNRALLDTWLDEGVTYHQILDLFPTEFGCKITYNKLQRYSAKRGLAAQVSTYCDTALSADDLLALHNGQPGRFSEAGLIVVQKRAFELAAEPKTSVSKLNSLLRILSYKENADLHQRRVKAAETSAEARLLSAEADIIRAFATLDIKLKKDAPAPENPAEVVMRRCGSANKFFQQLRDGERVTHCIQRLYNDIKNGTFVLVHDEGDDYADYPEGRPQPPQQAHEENIIPLTPSSDASFPGTSDSPEPGEAVSNSWCASHSGQMPSEPLNNPVP